jgi:choline-sulfatase
MNMSEEKTTKTALNQPNILIFMVDEMRYPTVYESPELKDFRSRCLTTQNLLRQNGMEFNQHYIASVACAPSRTTFWTGHYPSLHGVTNTDGAAKSADEEDMFWLDPDTVPTVGDYFRAAGYRTFWKGKWHISEASIIVPGTSTQLQSYDANGNRDAALEQMYINAGRLEDYGFSGWIGPEPHGSNPLNSASSAGSGNKGRDEAYADQIIELLGQLDADSSSQPWLTVASLVNPHDIVLWGFAARLGALAGQFDFTVGDDVPEKLFDRDMFAPSHDEDLSSKPSCQQSFRDSYKNVFQPAWATPKYYRYYYQLHQNVDAQMRRIYDALRQTRFFENTIVVFTSDHGDMLGAHGGLMQKWYQTYQESVHVPFIVSNPLLFPNAETQTVPTSHADFVPTILGLAGLDAESLRQNLASSHTEARTLVGRNLAPLILGEAAPEEVKTPLYFMTDDDPSRGNNQQNFIGIDYDSVAQPNHIECVIAEADGKLWKYSRYFDNPQFWTNPGVPGSRTVKDVVIKPKPFQPDLPGETTVEYIRRVKYKPFDDEYELYNVTDDALELNNLAGNPAYAQTEDALRRILSEQCAQKRLTPNSGIVPGQTACIE